MGEFEFRFAAVEGNVISELNRPGRHNYSARDGHRRPSLLEDSATALRADGGYGFRDHPLRERPAEQPPVHRLPHHIVVQEANGENAAIRRSRSPAVSVCFDVRYHHYLGSFLNERHLRQRNTGAVPPDWNDFLKHLRKHFINSSLSKIICYLHE